MILPLSRGLAGISPKAGGPFAVSERRVIEVM
jgi:hypothetical protein